MTEYYDYEELYYQEDEEQVIPETKKGFFSSLLQKSSIEQNKYPNYQVLLNKCKMINTRTFKKDVVEVANAISDTACPVEVKLTLGEWLFRKIYMYYKPKEKERIPVCNNLKDPIRKSTNTILKGRYIWYHNISALEVIAEEFFLNRFDDQDTNFILQMLNDVALINANVEKVNPKEVKDNFIRWINSTYVYEQKSNLLDTLLRYYKKDKDVLEIYDKMKFGESKTKDVYSNQQNAHDEDITTETMKMVHKLLAWCDEQKMQEEPDENVVLETVLDAELKFLESYNIKGDVVDCVFTRMKVDNTMFNGYHIYDIFLALMYYIKKSPMCDELLKRLYEEMTEMDELCATGYVNRFINVLQGYDEHFTIKMSFEKQLYAVISNILSKEMERATEEVIEGTYNMELQKKYLEFVSKIINSKMPYLCETYGEKDVLNSVCKVCETLTSFDKWYIKDKKLIY